MYLGLSLLSCGWALAVVMTRNERVALEFMYRIEVEKKADC